MTVNAAMVPAELHPIRQRALTYTAITLAVVLLLLWMIRWSTTKPPGPVPVDLIEVNLGNEQEGEGDVQPLKQGEMSPNPPAPEDGATASAPSAAPDKQDIQPDENEDADAAPVTKAEKAKPSTNPYRAVTKPTPTKNPTPSVAPSPKPQQPKFVYNGPGKQNGNNADRDNGYQNQGTKPGRGDNGIPTGKPDSYGSDPGGRVGVGVTSGVRPSNLSALRFEDEFNQNARVEVRVRYNGQGSVTNVSVDKTNTTDRTILAIARRKANELKFPANGAEGGESTIQFNFKLQQ